MLTWKNEDKDDKMGIHSEHQSKDLEKHYSKEPNECKIYKKIKCRIKRINVTQAQKIWMNFIRICIEQEGGKF